MYVLHGPPVFSILGQATFNAIVRQEPAFFETGGRLEDDFERSPFALSSRLADDTELVAKAYGNPLASFSDVLT